MEYFVYLKYKTHSVEKDYMTRKSKHICIFDLIAFREHFYWKIVLLKRRKVK
jgi:hypothetical protein